MTSDNSRQDTSPARKSRKASDILAAGEIRRLAIFSFVLLIIVPAFAWFAGGNQNWAEANWRPGFTLSVFSSAPLVTRIHTLSILTLVVAGWIMLSLPKGDKRHKTFGWIWVGAMSAMGISSLLVPHGDSWVAAYVGGGSALVLMAFGMYSVKRRHLARHGKMMSMLMIALVLMTLLSILPGRLMHEVFFGG